MKVLIVLFFLWYGVLLAEVDVIKVSGKLNEDVSEFIWPALASGGIYIDNKSIYISNGSSVYVQSRTDNKDYSYINIEIDGHNYFRISRIHINRKYVYLNLNYIDGKFYLCRLSRETNEIQKLIKKHAYNDRMLQYRDGRIVSGGFYRPNYADLLSKYDDESTPGKTKEEERQFTVFYESEVAFSLSIYDENLSLIDSANFLNRIGEDARAFDGLYTKHPMDFDEFENLYLIDNSGGYVVEKYNSSLKQDNAFDIMNESFQPVPRNLTMLQRDNLRSKNNQYSLVYALYVKGDMVITSFCESYFGRRAPGPPYFFDVTTKEGEHIGSGKLEYPIISEDQGENIFLLVVVDGGWFDDDEIYLVGMTIDDLLAGKGQAKNIEQAIEVYTREAR